ncbi:MAG: cyclic nucleotide-binding domain-containing protein [Xenococcaceae cyanobacterium]
MTVVTIYPFLRETSIAKNLTDEELHRLAQVGTLEEFPTNTTLIREGEKSDVLMVLLEGETEILKTRANQEIQPVAKLNAGSVIGEMGLFLARPRKATVKTLTPCKLLVFQQKKLHELVEKGDSLVSKVAINLGRVISYKLETLNDNVIDLWADYDELLTTIETLKNSRTNSDLEPTRQRLLQQAKQLRQSQTKVEKQLNYLNNEIQRTKLTRRVAELVIAIVAGGLTTLMILRLIGMGLAKIQVPFDNDIPSPTAVPYINTPEDCDKRSGSVWHKGTCWDLTHGADW